ncbi:MAG: hypothetical protein ACM3UY_04965 [Methanocella sp.]
MKGLGVFLIFLLLASVLMPVLSVTAQPAKVPHEDPEAVGSALDSFSFLSQYAEIFALVASRQYSNASELSEQLKHITVPENLRYVIDRYNDLTRQLITVLGDLDSTLNTAESLLDQNRLSEAGKALQQAGVLVAKAQILLDDLKAATLTMSQRLGVFSSAVASKVRDAYDTLQRMLLRLQELIDLYHQLLERANQRAEAQLDATSLSLGLNATSCFVGDYLHVSGTLASGGVGLAGRAVELQIDGQRVAMANTDSNGEYSALIRVPYKYVDHVLVNALYTPQGGDKTVYLASASPMVRVEVLFYRTLLEVALPSVAYPGLALSIQGNVTSEDGLPLGGRQVRVVFDGQVIGQVLTDGAGGFAVRPVVGANATLGNHTLSVRVDSSGLYAGVSVSRVLLVQKMVTKLEVSAASLVVLPSSLYVNGSVASASGPLGGASVHVVFANSSTVVKSASDGSFNVTVEVPFNTVFAGNQELKVTVVPAQPWQATVQRTEGVLVLNPISIAVALVCSFSVVFVMYSKFSGVRGKKGLPVSLQSGQAFVLPPKGDASAVEVVGGVGLVQVKFEGLKGRVLRAYVSALSLVQSVTGESLMPDMTLHEYLVVAGAKCGGAVEAFSALTGLAEKSLYSPHVITEAEAVVAEQLVVDIGGALNGSA